ncbi:hypothetical protein F2P56_017185 [Juglans regia]|uniref:Uncharacterized protein n=1 Tax=Juglans regia TaxID=51240 RepID=A0A833XHQ5_JUGRE|nr:hypothetical protein F2P56_017185 [Juglans regia]
MPLEVPLYSQLMCFLCRCDIIWRTEGKLLSEYSRGPVISFSSRVQFNGLHCGSWMMYMQQSIISINLGGWDKHKPHSCSGSQGPVGVEGLLATRWGSGQVADGDKGVVYTYKDLTNKS